MKKLAMGAAVALTLGLTTAAGSAHPGAAIPNDDKAIAHVLDRAGFGPRPGDVARLRQLGLERYVDQQLHPERIPDADMPSRLGGPRP
jgi:hypothetical protein